MDRGERDCPSCGAVVDHPEPETINFTIDLSDVTQSLRQTNEELTNLAEALKSVNEQDAQQDTEPRAKAYKRQEYFPSDKMPHVKNYLALSILSTIFCCLPFGIPGIVFAAQVDKNLKAGDADKAIKSSKKAKTWTLISFIAGFAFWLCVIFNNARKG